jgi:hypothetical protein
VCHYTSARDLKFKISVSDFSLERQCSRKEHQKMITKYFTNIAVQFKASSAGGEYYRRGGQSAAGSPLFSTDYYLSGTKA